MTINVAQLSGDLSTFQQAVVAWATVAVPRIISAIGRSLLDRRGKMALQNV